MENKLNFIVLPKEEIMLTNDEAAMLLGGDNCNVYKICTTQRGTYCGEFNNAECSGSSVGGCGESMYCLSYSLI